MLAALALVAGCGGEESGGTSLTGSPRSAVPDEAVGTWSYGTVMGLDFYNPSTGVFSPQSGIGQSYTFHEDGEFVWGGVFQQTTYGCTITMYEWQHGTVVFDGTSFTRYPVEGAFRLVDSCNHRNDRDERRVDPPSTFTWEVTEEGGNTVFREYDQADQFWLSYRAQ